MASKFRFKYKVGQRVRHLGGTTWFRITTRRLNHGGDGHHRYWGKYQPSIGGSVGAYENQITLYGKTGHKSKNPTNHELLLKVTRDSHTDKTMLVKSLLELVEGVEGGWLVRDKELTSEKTMRSVLRRAHAALRGR